MIHERLVKYSHALPYIGIQTYEKQQELSGCGEDASKVRRYIAEQRMMEMVKLTYPQPPSAKTHT